MEPKLILSNENDIPEPTTVRKWTILITDDEPDVHRTTKFAVGKRIINGRQIEFIDAYSGDQAIQLVLKNPDINLMLLDAVMATADDGIKCAKHIRETLGLTVPTIVMRTGFAGWEVELNKNKLTCIDDYILKSTSSLDTLIELLEKWLPHDTDPI